MRMVLAVMDFWVMKFDPVKKGWTHLSEIEGHPFGGRLRLLGTQQCGTRFCCLRTSMESWPRREVIAQIDAAHSGGNDFWVMKFVNPAHLN